MLISWNFLWTLLQLSSSRFNSFMDCLVSQMPQRLVQYVLTWRGLANIIDLVMNNRRSQKYWTAMWVDMAKRVRIFWADQLTHLKMTYFDSQPNLPANLIDPTRPASFCHVYQRWVDWDWGVIFIKYLLILLYLICYMLHYSLSFFICQLHFLFLL